MSAEDVTEFARVLRERIEAAIEDAVGRDARRVNMRYVDDAGLAQLKRVADEMNAQHVRPIVTRLVDEYRQITADGRRRHALHDAVHKMIDEAPPEHLDRLDGFLEAIGAGRPSVLPPTAAEPETASAALVEHFKDPATAAAEVDTSLETAVEAVLVKYGCPVKLYPMGTTHDVHAVVEADRGDLTSDIAAAVRSVVGERLP